MKISVCIPIHNEQDNIKTLYRELVEVLIPLDMDYEIIMVNDGSEDESGFLMDQIAENDKHVRAVHLIRNYGQACAMMAGFDNAAGNIIVSMDGDNQNDPKDILHLVNKIKEGYEVVSGWRKYRQDAKFSRIIPSMIANRLISKVSGVRLHDFGCSLKAYRKEVIKGVKLYGEMHRFIPIFAYWKGAKIAEIAVNHRPRQFGSSHYGIARVSGVLLDLAFIRFWEKHLQNPIHLFGGFGLINFLFALISFGLMVYYKFWGGKTFVETPLPTLTVLFVLIGFMAIMGGLTAEILMRTYYESQKEKPYLIDRIVN